MRDDDPTYDDPLVRQAAVEALGRYNGSVVAVDPNTGRILTIVNQKIAFSDGYIPCSTIKPTIAIAALEENVITSDTMLKVGRRKYMNLTEALAHSNNAFFEELGRRMGFDTVSKYGRLLGLGELPDTICPTNIRGRSLRSLRPLAAWRDVQLRGRHSDYAAATWRPSRRRSPTAAHFIICSTRTPRKKYRILSRG